MSNVARIFMLSSGIIFLFSIIRLLVKKRIGEQTSIFWLTGSFIILIFSAFPNILGKMARWIGIDYPPSLLFFVSNLVLLYLILCQSIEISELNIRLRELTQQFSLDRTLNGESETDRQVCPYCHGSGKHG